jgi:hypothetical protein
MGRYFGIMQIVDLLAHDNLGRLFIARQIK